jgi:hypothetical protein
MAMASTVACAASREKSDGEAVTGALDDLFAQSTLEERNGAWIVERPRILVKFERAGAESPLCPTGTAFRVRVRVGDEDRVVTLPTAVPTRALPAGSGLNDIFWIAADGDYEELAGLDDDFHFAVFFHPFVQSGNINYVSKPTAQSPDHSAVVGPLNMLTRTLLPEGVDYKYTIARVERVGTGDDAYFRLLEGCAPLDPRIRVY